MSSATSVRRWTAAEYLEFERAAETKSEFWNGEIFAMAGGSPRHSLIAVNVAGELRQKLKGGNCVVYNSDLRVKIEMADAYVYPDVSVVCAGPQFAETDVLLNPTIVVEILSDSTERYDRGPKFELYRRIPSLQEYLMVHQGKPAIEQYVRQTSGHWLFHETTGLAAALPLPSLNIEIALAEIFAKVDFKSQTDPSPP